MIPSSPKSGEHDVKIAPTAAVASIEIIVSGEFVAKTATLSPCFTPFLINHFARTSTFDFNSFKERDFFSFPSP